MSHCSRDTYNQKAAVIDHEKQFQEDLERAQALSLESLALEKFRLKKLQSNVQQTYPASSNVCSANSVVSEIDGCSQGEK